MKLITLILPFILLSTSGFSSSAEEAEVSAHGLVMLLDFREPGQPSNTIRVTIENRSKKTIKVIAPVDIKRPWGEGGWWYCGSYQFYLNSATQGLHKYVCDTPRPPAAVPQPNPPKLMTLLPGQSIGALHTLPLPIAVNAVKGIEPGEPPPSLPNWGKTDEEGKSKPPRSGYALTVEYCPVEYQSATNLGEIGSESTDLKLMPPKGKAISSNELRIGAIDLQPTK